MISEVSFKLGGLEDLPAMIKVGAQLFDHDLKEPRAREFLSDPRHHIVLAYFENGIIGMASGVHYVHPDKDPQLFINEVGVIEEYQNKGIGRQLVKSLCEHGKTLRCTEAWLGVATDNIPARRAYKAALGKEEKEPFVLVNFK
ncbi:MAG: GNAT family N-acetyltransferase [Flavobacteriaceae bacterium]